MNEYKNYQLNTNIFCRNLPCEDVRGSVEDFIAGLGGLESAAEC